MAEYTQKEGVKVVLLWRLLKDAKTKQGTKLAFQEEHSVELSLDGADAKQTKDGAILTPGIIEEEVPFTSTMANNDDVRVMLAKAFIDQDKVELWEVDLNEKDEDGKYEARYRQGLITDFTENYPSDDMATIEGTFKTEGIRQDGVVTLTTEQEETAQYAFRDTAEYTN